MKKDLNVRDILAIAFGAMIGWGWVINSGDWLVDAGFLGSTIAFVIGGIMVLLVGFTYAELTSAMPKHGGELSFSLGAFGPTTSFVCTWALILSYLAVAAFEATALPLVFRYIFGDGFKFGYLYTIQDYPIYASDILIGVGFSILISVVNIAGIKKASFFQKILTVGILVAALLLFVASLINGNGSNIASNLWGENATQGKSSLNGILAVVCMTPCFLLGFDVIPQVAGEYKSGYRKLGKLLIISIIMTVAFYLLIIFSCAYIFNLQETKDSLLNGLVTADAMAKAFSSKPMGIVLIVGGLCGIVSTWNSFVLGSSKTAYYMSQHSMLPKAFSLQTKKSKTPAFAIAVAGVICSVATLFGKPALLWMVDAAGLGSCITYLIVSLSFLRMRKKCPDMERPYKVKYGTFIGVAAVVMSSFFIFLYIVPLPFSDAALTWQEWIMVGAWTILGGVLYLICRLKSKKNFGVPSEEMLASRDEGNVTK